MFIKKSTSVDIEPVEYSRAGMGPECKGKNFCLRGVERHLKLTQY
jgi:hypothetical protein